MRSNEEIRQIIEDAFKPLYCGVDVFDFDAKVRFKVFDSNMTSIFACPGLMLSALHDDNNLRAVLEQARESIAQQGFALDPWSL